MASRITRFLPCETDYTAGSAKTANQLIVDNGRLLVAKADIAAAAVGSCFVRGVEIAVTKASGTAWAEGDRVYYDETNANFGVTYAIGLVYAGLATRDATSGATTGYVDLGARRSGTRGTIKQTVLAADIVDGGAATGYIDLSEQIPLGARPVGWRFKPSVGFTGDTTCVLVVGVSGDTDRFSSVTTGSVFGTTLIGSLPASDGCAGIAAAQTVRLTFTSATDITLVKATAGAGVIELDYDAQA